MYHTASLYKLRIQMEDFSFNTLDIINGMSESRAMLFSVFRRFALLPTGSES